MSSVWSINQTARLLVQQYARIRTARFATSCAALDDSLCNLSERHKYQSWPSEEHAAFAFARLAKPGHTTIGLDEFIDVLKRMQLDYNLGDRELRRVFDALDANGDGRLSIEEFKVDRGEHPFTKTLVEALSGACHMESKFSFDNFDYNKSTAEFYRAPLDYGFFGDNVGIRKLLDYRFHGNYTKERQLFQDALIKSNLLLGAGSDKPWYVLTCGPMVSVVYIGDRCDYFVEFLSAGCSLSY
jgi:hypothetical protein